MREVAVLGLLLCTVVPMHYARVSLCEGVGAWVMHRGLAWVSVCIGLHAHVLVCVCTGCLGATRQLTPCIS